MFIVIGKLYLSLNHIVFKILSLKQEFSKSFFNSDLVLLCPIYAAGEKKDENLILLNLQINFKKF